MWPHTHQSICAIQEIRLVQHIAKANHACFCLAFGSVSRIFFSDSTRTRPNSRHKDRFLSAVAVYAFSPLYFFLGIIIITEIIGQIIEKSVRASNSKVMGDVFEAAAPPAHGVRAADLLINEAGDNKFVGSIMEMGDLHVNFGGENGVKLSCQEVGFFSSVFAVASQPDGIQINPAWLITFTVSVP